MKGPWKVLEKRFQFSGRTLCRTTKIPGNDHSPTEVHQKPVREDYASSWSSFKQERMALGPSSRRIFLSLEERNDLNTSSHSLLLWERNCYICRRLIVWIRSSPLASPRGWHKEANCLRFVLYDIYQTKIRSDREIRTHNYLGFQKVCWLCPQ